MQRQAILLVLILSVIDHISFCQKADSTKNIFHFAGALLLPTKVSRWYPLSLWENPRPYLTRQRAKGNFILNLNCGSHWKENHSRFFFGGDTD
jgi:hypothetical protein